MVLVVAVPWALALEIAAALGVPAGGHVGKDYAAMVVAVLGTTISPYLFFWQASQEVEDMPAPPGRQRACAATRRTPREHLSRIKQDTVVGMVFSNVDRAVHRRRHGGHAATCTA